MFHEFYGLNEQPFGVTPDPRFFYLSPAHREALSSVFCGVQAGRGFLALIAKPGMGKTTLLFHLLAKLRPSTRTAFLFQNQCTSREFMRFLLAELGLMSHGEDLVTMHEEFNRCMLEEAQASRRFIVVIDEAQNLEPSVLETVRLLKTPQAKLLQIILSGPPELADKLARPSLRQLRQRVSLFSTLGPLPPNEVERYIDHRLRTAGYQGDSMFTPDARKMIAQESEGIPRCINNLCFNALSLGCALRQRTIGLDTIRETIADLDLADLGSGSDSSDFESKTPVAHSFVSVEGAVGARSKIPSKCLEKDGVVRDEITKLVQGLFLRPEVKGPRRVVFAGTESGSGCTWMCAHTADVLASQIRASVCVVDCNLRSPRLHQQFGLENHHGLSDALHSSDPIRQYAHQLSRTNLWLLSCGSTADNWQTLLASDRMRQRLTELRAAFDYVLIDATPLSICNDAIALGGLSDGVVLVLKANSSRRETARQALQELRAANVPIFGAVLNQRTFPIPDKIYRRL